MINEPSSFFVKARWSIESNKKTCTGEVWVNGQLVIEGPTVSIQPLDSFNLETDVEDMVCRWTRKLYLEQLKLK